MITSAQKLLMARAGVSAGVPIGPAEYVGFNDTNTQGSYVLDYPAGTQQGDLLFLLCGNDESGVFSTPSGWTQIAGSPTFLRASFFYRFAESSSGSVTAPAGDNPSAGGAIICTFRNSSFVQHSEISGVGGSPFSFPSISDASVGNTCVCFTVADDDIPTADATQTGFTVVVSDFYGSSSSVGCSMHVTYSIGVVDATTYTPPNISISGVSNEPYSVFSVEII